MQTTSDKPKRQVHPAAIAKAKRLRERQERVLSKAAAEADRLGRQAHSLEKKGYAYADQSDEETLERLNSWDSNLRRIGKDARTLKKLHNSDLYIHAMKLYRFLYRVCGDEAKKIDFTRLTKHMKFGATYVRMMLDLLQGKSIKVKERPDKRRKAWEINVKRGEKLLPGFPANEHGRPLLTVKPAVGRRTNVYALAPPPQFASIWEAEEAGLLGE